MVDIYIFRHDYLRNLNNPKMGIEFKKLYIPSAADFNLPDYSFSGYPQTSLASKEVFD
jgi:hypothetical protein